MAGIKFKASNSLVNGDCSLSIPVQKGTTDGLLAAGHCIDDDSDAHQPSIYWWFNKIGKADGSKFSGNTDAAFIEKTSSEGLLDGVFHNGWSGGYSYWPITSKSDFISGKTVYMGGYVSGVVTGGTLLQEGYTVPTDIDGDGNPDLTLYNMVVVKDILAADGDSGGAIFSTDKKYYGPVSSSYTNPTSGIQYTFHSEWSNIASDLGIS